MSFVLAAVLGLGTAAAAAPPVADAGDPRTICAPSTGAQITLDGTGSSDPDSDPLTYEWTDASMNVLSTEPMPTLPLLPGVHVITLTVDDGQGGTATDTVQITLIADDTPPVLVLASESDELWPPNHKLHGYDVDDLVLSVSDDCSDLTKADVVFGHATSDEPDDDRGDGNTHADVQFSNGCRTAAVRAERSGPGDGRVYELTLDVADEAGNHPAVPQVFTVAVPHDRAHGAGDDGDAETYECTDALSTCRSTPVVCTGAGSGDVDLRASRKGPSLRWRSSGFPAGGVSAQDNLLCAYVNGVAVGGSLAPDKVRVKDKKGEGSLSVKTRGDDLELPLPLASGATLRLELRDGAGNCVSYDEVVE